ncbi:MAG: ABC transporter ATP-binding protein [Pseudomonadota bacterium]
MTGPILELEGVSKAFGALVVTDGVSLTLRHAECHALIGPNGAGKTTLMQQITGLAPPDSGRIRFAGKDITELSPAARARAGLGRSFQISAVIPSFSALENAALAAQARAGSSFRFLRPARSERRLNDVAMTALNRVGLAHRAAIPAGSLSHGERRLLELAVALAAEPKGLLLDEPMAGLGHAEGVALTERLAALAREIPLLLVEHDMDAVFTLADRVSVLVAGRIIASGAPDAVRADPAAREAYLGEEASA